MKCRAIPLRTGKNKQKKERGGEQRKVKSASVQLSGAHDFSIFEPNLIETAGPIPCRAMAKAIRINGKICALCARYSFSL